MPMLIFLDVVGKFNYMLNCVHSGYIQIPLNISIIILNK